VTSAFLGHFVSQLGQRRSDRGMHVAGGNTLAAGEFSLADVELFRPTRRRLAYCVVHGNMMAHGERSFQL
jgi:hypothetical protein